MRRNIIALISIYLLILLLPANVLGECTCTKDGEGDHNKSLSLRYKIVAIASILTAGALGVCIPVLGKRIPALSPEGNSFLIIKAFAAGVILATGFIHILPDAFDHLTSPCIAASPWGDFPFTGFIAMVAAIGTLMVDAYATSYYRRRSVALKNGEARVVDGDEEGAVAVPHAHGHGHSHGNGRDGETDVLRHRVISQVLELGIIVHSVIIGVSLGASASPKTVKPLLVALTFHQFFEGIGLGGCITQARFNWRAVSVMGLFFSLTTPIGIAVGIGISNIYSETSPTALIVEGVLNAASSGILIYMALVDLLAADFMSPKLQENGKLQLGANVSLLVGAGCMSLLAKWA